MTQLRSIALALVGGWSATARAEFLATVTVAVAPEVGDWFRYEYAVAVEADSTLPAVQFDLAVASAADLQGIETPDGWSFDYDAAAGAISFFADEADAPIAPGSSGLFAFLSRLAPVDMEYFLTGIDPPDFQVLDGVIASPGVAIPEPSSLVLLGVALGIVLIGPRRD